MISLYYPTDPASIQYVSIFFCSFVIVFLRFSRKVYPTRSRLPHVFFFRALSRISFYRMVSIHGFTFGS